MAYFGKGDPDRHRGAGDPCRSAVDLHVDNDGGLVRSDDGRHAGHDGSGNDAVTGRIRSLSSASNLRHWSSTSFGVSEFFATKAVSRACSRTLAAFDSARQAEPSAFVLDEPSCYDFRVLDPPPGYKVASSESRQGARADRRWYRAARRSVPRGTGSAHPPSPLTQLPRASSNEPPESPPRVAVR